MKTLKAFRYAATVMSAAGGFFCFQGFAQTALTYQKPPAGIEQLLEAPPTPTVRLSPNRKTMLIEQPATFPTIADVAQPRYRLAGIRFMIECSRGLPLRAIWLGLTFASQPCTSA